MKHHCPGRHSCGSKQAESLILLALDTSTDRLSVALSVGMTVFLREEILPQRHGERILFLINEVLTEAALSKDEIDVLAFSAGPGSFTGIRIAVSVVQAFAWGLDRPVVPVSTLAVLAQGAYRTGGARYLLIATDARLGQGYFGAYHFGDEGIVVPEIPDQLITPDQAPLARVSARSWLGVGSLWTQHHEWLSTELVAQGSSVVSVIPELLPSARDVVALAMIHYRQGKGVPVEQAFPVYLK